jgi:hypothetical protein
MAESSSGGSSGYEAIQRGPELGLSVAEQQAAIAARSGQGATPQIVGGNIQSGVVRPDMDPVTGWGGLGQTIQRILEPQIQLKEKANFWQGVVAARSGMAIKDIVDTQSPLSKIFGPSSYVQGAQFYNAQDNIARFNQDMIQNAEDIAKVPPSELGKRLNAEASKYETGDPGTDALTHSAWVENTAPMLNVVNKTRYAMQQRDATQAFVNNAQNTGNLLAAMGPHLVQGTANEDDLNLTKQQLVHAIMPPPGMDPATWRATLPKLTSSFADNGNFHAVELMKASGALDQMDLEQRTKLDDRLDKKAKEAAVQYRASVAPQMSDLTASVKAGAMTPEIYQQEMSKLQKDFTQRTGNREPLAPYSEQEGNYVVGRTNWWNAQKDRIANQQANSLKEQNAAEKARVEAQESSDVNRLISIGSVGEYARLGGNAELATAQFTKAYEQYQPQERDQLLTNNYTGSAYVNPVVQNRMQSALRTIASGGEYSPALEQTYTDWARLNATPKGQATAAAYYSEDQQARLNKFDMLKKGGVDSTIAFQSAFKDPLTAAVDWTKTHGVDKDVVGVVNSQFNQWFPAEQNLDDTSKRLVAGLIMKNVGTTLQNTGLTTEQASYQALHNLRANGLEVFGGRAWMKTRDQKPLEQMITGGKATEGPNAEFDFQAVPHKALSEVMNDVIGEGLKKSGLNKAETVQILRLPDVNGKAHFAALGYSKEGVPTPYQFDSDEISKSYNARLSSKNGSYSAPSAGMVGGDKSQPKINSNAYRQGWESN